MPVIVLVRHGETDWNRERIFRGRADISLNDNGLEQARKTARALRDMPVEAVYSSPLSRALMTAREIASVFNLPVETVEAFNDIDFGEWEGMPVRDVGEKYPAEFRRWRETPHLEAPPGGEAFPAVRERAGRQLDRLAGSRESGALVVVTHRVVLKLLLIAALKLGEEKFWSLQQDPCAVNILHYRQGRYILSRFNETCHLYNLARSIEQVDF